MTKATTAGMDNHLAQQVTNLATCWRVTRVDTQEFFFTDHDVAIPFDGDIYQASTGYKRTAIQSDASMAVDNLDIQGIFDSAQITVFDLRAGLFDYAQIRIFVVNWSDLADGNIKMRNGRLGEVTITEQGIFRAELRGLTQALSQRIGELYQPECRTDLGEPIRCRIPIQPDLHAINTAYALGAFIRVATAGGIGQQQFENRIYECTVAGTTTGTPPTYDTVVGNTTVDGTATFTAFQAWTRSGLVETVGDRKTVTLEDTLADIRDVDDWFDGGAFIFEDGENSGRVIEIRGWVKSTREITLFLPAAFNITVGTVVRLYPGCDKISTTCISKFVMTDTLNFNAGNIKNFRGEPFVPGQDELIRYPDAQ